MKKVKNTDMKHDRTFILDSMPVNKAIRMLAIPTMVAMLIQVIYNMTDTFFIGKLNDPNMIAAISLSMPIFMIIQAFGNIFAIGGASVISRFLGEGEKETASKAGSIAFWSSFVTCTIVSIIGFFFMEPILIFCGASANTIGFAKGYLSIMLIGSPFIGMQMAMGGLLRSEGATKESMIGMMAGSIINIALDPIFILLLNMGVAGAALATTIGNICGFMYYISFYFKKRGVISISPKLFSFDKKIYTGIFKIGIPASIGMVLMSIGFAISNMFAASFGDEVIAASGVVMRSTNISVMLAIGLAQGCQPLMGYSYGAKNYKRLFETVKKAITAGTIICTVFAVVFFVFADTTIRIFINDPVVIDLGVKIIRVFVLSMPFLGLQMVLMTMFQSLGKTVESLVVSLGRQGLFFIPALIIFSSLWGFEGFIFAQPIADIATTILSLSLFFFMRKKLHMTSNDIIEDDLVVNVNDNNLDNINDHVTEKNTSPKPGVLLEGNE
ncbi:MATE family efflux transporter [Alkalibaculum sp. M08DMB]|uniref:Multidrug export protein MepA n=1 Tax=Alkalibaculum sporogenes TaxID=2655001 RepID=A0A6A7K8Y5_9FIRM|nr:MATE family efflux transporter [Alkalibaculum sporogenes]MPW25866.1 MATE family efflux transporter [Alkalibaculum sporogenes]